VIQVTFAMEAPPPNLWFFEFKGSCRVKSHGINANVGLSGAFTRPNVRLSGAARPAKVRLGGCDFSRQIP
jgi:hypothetical protein